jgi:hypothetical protein
VGLVRLVELRKKILYGGKKPMVIACSPLNFADSCSALDIKLTLVKEC